MFYSCPHCRELVATDPVTRQPPELCPRCGGSLQLQASTLATEAQPAPVLPATPKAARSLATFLQRKAASPAQTSVEPAPITEFRQDSDGPPAEPAGPPGAVDSTLAAPAETPESPAASLQADADPTQAVVAADNVSIGAPVGAFASHAGPLAAETAHVSSAEPAQAAAACDPDGTPAVVDQIDACAEPDSAAPSPAASTLPLPTRADAIASPSFTREATTRGPRARANTWQWAALFVLGIALLLQVLLADRARLAADANWRPLMASLCNALGCTLPPWRQPDAFAMLARDVRPLRDTPGALQVQATFRNDARWAQPWPVVRLSLSDADGRVVGARAFRPDEYLDHSGDEAATQTLLAPGQSARVVLHLREPTANVVAFSFDFR